MAEENAIASGAKVNEKNCFQRTKEKDENPSNNMSIPDEIRQYKQLFDDGIITKEEFESKKKQLLRL